MVWVLEHSQAEHAERLVMISLANHAGDEHLAWPSVKTIGSESRLGERTVQVALRSLEQLGEIEAVGRARRGTTIYRIIMDGPKRGAESAPPQNPHPAESAGEGVQNAAPGGAESAPEPSKEPSSNPQTAEDGRARAICDRLVEHFRSVDPNGRPPRESVESPDWRPAATAMLAEGRDFDQILELMDWVANDSWWRARILSPRHLRNNYVDVFGRATSGKPGRPPAVRGRRDRRRKLEHRAEQRQRQAADAGACCHAPGAPPSSAEAEWAAIAARLQQDVSPTTWDIWLAPAHPHIGPDGELLLGVPEHLADWVADRHAGRIQHAAGRPIEIVHCQETSP